MSIFLNIWPNLIHFSDFWIIIRFLIIPLLCNMSWSEIWFLHSINFYWVKYSKKNPWYMTYKSNSSSIAIGRVTMRYTWNESLWVGPFNYGRILSFRVIFWTCNSLQRFQVYFICGWENWLKWDMWLKNKGRSLGICPMKTTYP